MADPLTKAEMEQISRSWAKDATLDEISGRIGNTNDILLKIGAAFGKRFDASGLNREFKKTADQVKGFGDDAAATATGLGTTKRRLSEYNASLDDLKGSLRSYKRSIGDLITGAKDPISMLPAMLKDAGNSVALFGSKGRAAAPVLAAAGAAAGAVVQRLLEAGETYREMIQSGVLFSGSITDMVATVRASGVSLRKAGEIAARYSTTLLVTGEKNFFSTVTNMNERFARFGLTVDQGAEALAELSEIQRLSGSLYSQQNMSQEQIVDSYTKLLGNLNAQARLTGISVKQQLEQQKAVAQEARLQILTQRMRPEQQRGVEAATAALGGLGLTNKQISGTILEAIGEGVSVDTAKLRTLLGDAFEDVIGTVRGAIFQGQDATRIQQTFGRGAEQLGRRSISEMVPFAYAKDQEFAEIIAAIGRAQLSRTRGANVTQQEEDAKKLREGQTALTEGTVSLYTAQNKITQAFGTLESRIAEGATPALDKFTQYLEAGAAQLLKLSGQSLPALGTTAAIAAGASAIPSLLKGMLPGGATGTPGGTLGPAGAPMSAGGRMLGAASTFAGRVFGYAQAGQAIESTLEGNYMQAGMHAVLFALRKNPIAMAVSGADAALEITTGRGVIDRLGDEYQSVTQARERIQESAAELLRTQQVAGAPSAIRTEEDRVRLEAYIQSLVTRFGELQARGQDERNQEYRELKATIEQQTNALEKALRNLE